MTLKKNINFREKMLEDQARVNYQNEYNQIKGALAHSVLSIESRHTLQWRENELKNMGAKIA